VGLTARALGADRVVLADEAGSRGDTIEDITERFGGPFAVESTDSPLDYIREWDGQTVHLTMYGLPIQDRETEIRDAFESGHSLLVVVGAEKVPFDVYEQATHNVAVTNQPHSEIASLAVFLDHLYESEELDREWEDAERAVVPKKLGKQVEEL